MSDNPRLIEVAFPLQQASIDSVHEKSVRHGHISTLHIWPARRPLAASRAALIAALLDDPSDPEERRKLLERLGGRVVKEGELIKKNGKQVVIDKEQTVGGVLHWGQEKSPDIEYFCQKIHEKFGRAPRVLDPFAGGGAIPLEAMRMGCEAIAVDINPVAWFILKCTLEYPQKLAGKTHPLPEFATQSRDFMEKYYKAQGMTKKQIEKRLASLVNSNYLPGMQEPIEENLAWHVRAWGMWVLEKARKELVHFYPIVEGKTSFAYLWARTVQCKECRSTLPLLKTLWVSKTARNRVCLAIEVDGSESSVQFSVHTNVPKKGRDYDNKIGAGTMSKAGAKCIYCGTIMTLDDIRVEGKAKRLGAMPTCVVVEGDKRKEYRVPTPTENRIALDASKYVEKVFEEIPFGLPSEPTPGPAGPRQNSSSLRIYGLYEWKDLFSDRQLVSLGTFITTTRRLMGELPARGYSTPWTEAIVAELALCIDRLVDYSATLCIWDTTRESMNHVFGRYALPVNWDYAEVNPISNSSGSYLTHLEWVCRAIEHLTNAVDEAPVPTVLNQSAKKDHPKLAEIDLVLTDPPYYDAIMYSDIMDYFYVWLKRTTYGLSSEIDAAFNTELSPKWDTISNDGELVDDPSRFDNDKERSKYIYESGMFDVFHNCHQTLSENGRVVIVFANKQPDAWETLVSAIIRAGFVVESSWPIQTEMSNRMRARESAALSSSIWLVCRKRPAEARPGWDNRVIAEMEEQIVQQLRDFWDAGIRGPDFVWAATGPAMQAYSKHPIVRKANEPGELLTVSEFLDHARRIVVDFVVGRVLSQNGSADNLVHLDNVTNYYLLHRYDYGTDNAPVNAAILYAMSCNISDQELLNQYNILQTVKGSDVKLMPWQKRKSKNMGYQVSGGRPVPLIDKAHRLMHLWKAGDLLTVNEYIDTQGLRRDALFSQLLQALIELATAGSDERAYLESISNHLGIATGQEVARLFKD